MTSAGTSTLAFIGRVLSGRFTADEVMAVGWPHLVTGLLFTWIAGVGRYWDSPRASILQHLGLGSVAYVLVLSAFLWLLVLPLRPARWSYFQILTFVCAVAPPAILYAIPVERFMSLEDARTVNVWFLAVVAAWRVALYVLFLARYAGFRWLRLIVAALLPLSLIVGGLTALNLERAVFDIMAGLDPNVGTSADSAYAILFVLTLIAFQGTPILLVLYGLGIYLAWRAARTDSRAA